MVNFYASAPPILELGARAEVANTRGSVVAPFFAAKKIKETNCGSKNVKKVSGEFRLRSDSNNWFL